MGRPRKEVTQVAPSEDVSKLFSPEELKALEAEATSEFNDDKKSLAAEAFKAETKKKLNQKAMFAAGKDASGKNVESVTIDLAPHSPWITLDGRMYYHGVTYKFTTAQAQTVKEVMYRTWAHEREIGNANMNALGAFRQPSNRSISPNSSTRGAA